jgi:hypothetical protein
MVETIATGDRLEVFISYSRDDREFADNLDAALRLGGFETRLDRTGIAGGEKWEEKLGALIRDCDTIVFVLSPSSAGSKVCAWEVEEAVRLGKRLIPVLCRPLGDVRPPPALAALNYIYFYPEPKKAGTSFATGLHDLATALKTDLGWLRQHTRLLQRAAEWVASGREESRLLFADGVVDAKAWVLGKPKDAPEPTTLQFEFIRASEEADARRQSKERKQLEEMAAAQSERAKALTEKEAAQKQEAIQARKVVRRTLIGLAAALVLGAIATYAAVIANLERKAAVEAKTEAIEAQRVAEEARSEAEAREKEIALANQRLGVDMKLRIAPFGRDAYSMPGHWYKLATTNAASIVFVDTGQSRGTGFLIKGRELNPDWGDADLVVTARHLVRGASMAPRNADDMRAFFPAINEKVRLRLGPPRWESARGEGDSGVDVIIFPLADPLPEGAKPVEGVSALDVTAWPEVQFVDNGYRVAGSVLDRSLPLVTLGGSTDREAAEKTGKWVVELTLSLANALGRARQDVDRIVFTNSSSPGASGSPLFEADTGRLVGIVQRGTGNLANSADPGLAYSAGVTMKVLRDAIAADLAAKKK